MDRLYRFTLRSLALCAALAAGRPAFGVDPPSGAITLRDALEAALRTNPDLAAAAVDVRASDARIAQARLLPNPRLAAEGENIGSSGEEGSEPPQATLRLAQLIELGGKRDKRGRLAALERDGTQWDYAARRASVLAETAARFVDVLALQERRALAADATRAAEEFQRTVEAQVRAGAVSPVDAGRARVALGEAQLALAERDRELAAARVALAFAAWGDPTVSFDRAAGNLSDIAAPPPAPAIDVSANPDVARWTTERAAREAALSLEQARVIPDVTVGAGPRYFVDSQELAAVVDLEVPLPVFDRNQGAIAAATEALTAAGERQRAAALAARTAVARATETLASAHARAVALRDNLIPAAESASASARDGYRSGALRYAEVVDAQLTWFALRDQYLSALTVYHLARIDLDRLAGADMGAGTGGQR